MGAQASSYRLRACAGALVLIPCVAAYAQAPRPDAGQLLEQTRPAPAAPPSGTVPLAPPAPPRMSAPNNIKVTVKDFRFSGNTVVSSQDLQAEVASFRGKSLDMQGLNDVLDAVKEFYHKRGYFLAVPYFPRQNLTSGNVEIYVIEGRIGRVNVDVAPGAHLRPSVAQRYMSVLKPGDVVSESTVYRPLLLLQDLPGVGVKSTMGPGQRVGEADLKVEVTNSGSRFGGGLEVDNFGNKYAGTHRLSGQVVLNDPTGFGDQLSVRGLVSEGALTTVGTISYVLPVGPWGTKIGGSYTALHYRLEGETVLNDVGTAQNLGQLNSSGTGDISNLLLVHPLIRSVNFNLFGQFIADMKHTEDRVLTSPTSSVYNVQRRRVDAFRVGLVGDRRDAFFGGALNAFGLTVASGNARALSPDAVVADDNTPTGGNRIGGFTKVNLDYTRTQRITEQAYGILRLNGQWANRNLMSGEKTSVGGPGGVRAYPVGEGLADEAVTGTLEGRYTLPKFKLAGSDLALTAFFDWARIHRNVTQPASDTATTGFSLPIGTTLPNVRSLSGAGVGARLVGSPRYSIALDLAWRVSDDRAQSDVDRNMQAWIHGAVNF